MTPSKPVEDILRTDPVTKCSLASVGVSNDHIRINAVARNITCKKWIFVVLLKSKSFLQFQIAHNKAHTPTRMCLAVSDSIPTSHVPNNVVTEFGGVMLKAMCTVCHKTLANGQSKNRCLIVSSRSQKLHLVDHVRLSFTKLSFGNMTCLCTNHINTLIFKGTLTLQTYSELGMALELITSIHRFNCELSRPSELPAQLIVLLR